MTSAQKGLAVLAPGLPFLILPSVRGGDSKARSGPIARDAFSCGKGKNP